MLSKSRIKKMLKISYITNPFRHNTVQNVMNPSNSCISKAAISLPLKPCREVIASTITYLKDQSDVIRWEKSLESKCCWITEKDDESTNRLTFDLPVPQVE